MDMVRRDKQVLEAAAAATSDKQQVEQTKGTRPADLPVYGQAFLSRE